MLETVRSIKTKMEKWKLFHIMQSLYLEINKIEKKVSQEPSQHKYDIINR